MPLTRGARVGAYEVLEILGAGAMGEVYRARDTTLGRSVAIKILKPAAVVNPVAVRRFEAEARAASALNHPGIVTIHESGHRDGQYYIVMELVEGLTLRHLLRRGAPPVKKGLQLALQLAAALAKAHETGVVHRDLKPENVMVSSDGHVKIVDFGLAKLSEPGPGAKPGTESAPGVMLGTVGYMAPEQVRGEAADFRADQFAFGAILYELVTGERAFHRGTPVETQSMILNEEPAPPLELMPHLPAPLVWTIDRCLAKSPLDRYASTQDLARDVQTIGERAWEPVPGGTPHPVRPSRQGVLAVVIAAVVAGAAYVSLSPSVAVPSPRAPRFTKLTFSRGHVANARFGPGGSTTFYAASFEGAPLHVFETRPTGPESRAVGPASASLASVSSTGELAILVGCRLDWSNCVGTLAHMPQGGGAPREILENVLSADWTPDGASLAAIQATGGEFQVQFPPSNPLYTSLNRLGFLRFSPGGDRLAFVEYHLLDDEEGVLMVMDLSGAATAIGGDWAEIRDIAWAPDGQEIWVSASRRSRSAGIHAVSLSGESRPILEPAASMSIVDLASDYRALVATGLARGHMVWKRGDAARHVSWLDWSTVADLSSDGRTILFYEWGDAVETHPVVYLRGADAPDAVRLGEGRALALSPDGRWALALRDTPAQHLVLLPTGAGVSRELPSHQLTDIYWARWFPDGQRLLVVGDAPGGPGSYVMDVERGRLEPIAEKGMLAMLVSPDGRRVVVNDPLEGYVVWPLDGNAPVPLAGLDPRLRPVQWSADGRYLYVKASQDLRVQLHRYDILAGTSELLTRLAPSDPAGVIGVADGRTELAVTPDGTSYVFTYWSFVRDLYLVEGLPR
jgi:hypothetical protein